MARKGHALPALQRQENQGPRFRGRKTYAQHSHNKKSTTALPG
jgi:hypothetical protein